MKKGFALIELIATVVVISVVVGVALWIGGKCNNAAQALGQVSNGRFSNELVRAINSMGTPMWLMNIPSSNGVYQTTEEQFMESISNVHIYRIEMKSSNSWVALSDEIVGDLPSVTLIALDIARFDGRMNPQIPCIFYRIVQISP